MKNPPKVFISYSHDSKEHKKWCLDLAVRLRENGIDAIIDQFELKPGDDIPHFMETHLEVSNRILMICTDKYVQKANSGTGGVGYEKMIITSNLMSKIDSNKVIPIIRQKGTSNVPTFLRTKLYLNFSSDKNYEFEFDELIRTIHNKPIVKKPPITNNPFKEKSDAIKPINELMDSILAQIVEMEGMDMYVSGKELALKLEISEAYLRALCLKLEEQGYISITHNNEQVYSHDKGVLYAYENGLIKKSVYNKR